jgi:hypothetical protein
MAFFDTRRARVRPQFASLYPEIVPGVWVSARHATQLVRRRGPREQCSPDCARGRVLCEVHFEFKGGRRGRQYLTGEWLPRVSPVVRNIRPSAFSVGDGCSGAAPDQKELPTP